jgi:serine/threonine protein kinase
MDDRASLLITDSLGCVARGGLVRDAVGHAPYAAPEMFILPSSYDPSGCDAWSLGALVLFFGASSQGHLGRWRGLKSSLGALAFAQSARATAPLAPLALYCLERRPLASSLLNLELA